MAALALALENQLAGHDVDEAKQKCFIHTELVGPGTSGFR